MRLNLKVSQFHHVKTPSFYMFTAWYKKGFGARTPEETITQTNYVW